MSDESLFEEVSKLSSSELSYLRWLLTVKYIPDAELREGDNGVRDETVRVDEQDPERDQ